MRIVALAIVTCCLALPAAIAQENTQKFPTVTKYKCPQYPADARLARIQGTVTLLVTTDGHAVTNVKVVSGPQILAKPAEANVRSWKFSDHTATTFKVTYVYANEGFFKKDPATKCSAKMDLPTAVTVSTKFAFP